MRIAILTSARSGSTSLYHLIEAHLSKKNHICISEPFNNYWRDKISKPTYDLDFFENKKNIFIKTFVSKAQKPKSLLDNEDVYWDWFFNYFEKIILLDRIDKDSQSESLTYHMKQDDIHSWQKKQFYDLSITTSDEIQNSKNVLLTESNMMHQFSTKGYPLYYFEDIFIKKDKSKIIDMFAYLDIELNDSFYNDYVYSDLCKIRLNEGEPKFKSII
jgi:hypothetical protein